MLYLYRYIIITYLLYGTTALKGVWSPSNEGIFIWFNFSYTYFLLEAEWLGISTSPHFAQMPIFQAWGSLTSLQSQTRWTCDQDFYVLKKPIELSRVWTLEPRNSRRARSPRPPKLIFMLYILWKFYNKDDVKIIIVSCIYLYCRL